MTSANNFRALFGLARPKLPFKFIILFKAVAQHGIDGGLGAILLYTSYLSCRVVILSIVLASPMTVLNFMGHTVMDQKGSFVKELKSILSLATM